MPKTELGTGQGTDPLPFRSDFRRRTGVERLPKRAALEGTLANVRSLTVDAARTCLAGGALAYRLTTDGPATVRLSDGRSIDLPRAGTFEGRVAAPTLSAKRACVSKRRITLHVRRPRGMRIRSLTVRVNGKRVRTQRGNRRRTTVDLRGLPKGRVRVLVVVRGTKDGRKAVVRDRRDYRTCTPGRS